MIPRILETDILTSLKAFPAVAILGARQTGKTTLAKAIARQVKKRSLYLDIENPLDRDKLHDAYSFLHDHRDKLVIIDEVQRMPELFQILRSLIDQRRVYGRFLLLGSASPHIVRGVSESLAGRTYTAMLHPIGITECMDRISMKKHWFRGGFPEILMSKNDAQFVQRMDSFLTTFIERDLQSLFGVTFTSSVMRQFWQMLAHSNGGIWNAYDYARALGISAPTVQRYLDFLEGAFMVHKLPAFYFNARKRIIKAPKVYLRDSGIMHRMLRLADYDDLTGHVAVGLSWEAYVMEQIKQVLPAKFEMYYYRTQDGAEADVLLTKGGKPTACMEIKRSNAPKLSRGFYESIKDLETKKNFVITPTGEAYHKGEHVVVTGLIDFLTKHLPAIR